MVPPRAAALSAMAWPDLFTMGEPLEPPREPEPASA